MMRVHFLEKDDLVSYTESGRSHLVWVRPLGLYINNRGYLGTGREVIII